MKYKITLALLCSFFTALTFSQQKTTKVKRDCNVMELLEMKMAKNPNIAKRMNEMEAFTQRRIEQMAKNHSKISGDVIQIPVVVHVLYTNSTNNISNAQIQSQLDVLNADFRRTNADRTNKWSQAADTKIEFYLAEIDPNGNATTGITRTQVSKATWDLQNSSTSDDMKRSSKGGVDPWNTSEYLNMWIVDKLTRGTRTILGFAQFPWDTDKSTDGVVMADQYFGTTGTALAPFDGGRTTTHEVGHYLGLRHIWGDGPCGSDDFVADTPESDAPNYGCETGHTSCGSEDMVQNYMDYSDDSCMNLFTLGQKNRMHTYLNEGGARRALALSDKTGNTTPPSSSCSSTINSFPYKEGFESGLGAWTQASGDDFDWSRQSGETRSGSTGPTSASAGSYYMYTESSSPNYPAKTAIFNGPCFDLAGVSNPRMSFKYHMYGAAMGTLKLEAKEEGASGWTTIWSKTGNQGNSWSTAEVNLTAKKVQLRFHMTTSTSYTSDAAIDAITISAGSSADTQAPSVPTNLSVSNVAQTTLTLNWNASSDNLGVTGYDVYQGTTKLGTTTNTSVNITELSAGTSYIFSVRAKDAAGNISASSTAVNVTTLSNAISYCSSQGNRSTHEWIDNVELGGMKNATGDNGGYEDFTSKVATLVQGSSNEMIVSAGFKSTAYTEHWAVWIDFNQNGTFETSEKVVSGSSSSANNLRATVDVPAGANLGQTRMRVSMKYNSAQTSCETFDDGEVEDYSVNIVANSSRTTVVAENSNAELLGNEEVVAIVAYPNPARNYVSVRLASKAANVSYKIVNTLGSVVKTGTDLNNINISKINAGVYLLKVNDGQKTITIKLIKQ
ncbi:GEVED domain-containing protein [Tenacibaculum sp. 190524A02b]|uniref:Secreted protein (Por secretion system target) n=1 Tax=Tenacibaculum vairaonense TaxID=3137860 RepID=A0ABP1FG88_9FLAO